MDDRFSAATRACYARALDEAVRRRHDFVGADHLMLAVLDHDALALAAVADAGGEVAALRGAVAAEVWRGIGGAAAPMSLTPEAKAALIAAEAQAIDDDCELVEPGHVLIGLLAAEATKVARACARIGLSRERVTAALVARMASARAVAPPPPAPPAPGPAVVVLDPAPTPGDPTAASSTSADRGPTAGGFVVPAIGEEVAELLAAAGRCAAATGAGALTPVHLLYGLVRRPAGADSALGVRFAHIRATLAANLAFVAGAVPPEAADGPAGPTDLGASAQAVMLAADAERQRRGHAQLRSAHVLAGLLAEGGSAAAEAFGQAGLTLYDVRALLKQIEAAPLAPARPRGRRRLAPQRPRPPAAGLALPLERCTDRLRQVVAGALRTAAGRGDDFLGTVHLLLALIDDAGGIPHAVLANLAIEPAVLRARAAELLGAPRAPVAMPSVPTPMATRALDQAAAEARALGHPYIGTEHLLLGLIHLPDGEAMQVFAAVPVTAAAVRAEVFNLLHAGDPLAVPVAPPEAAAAVPTAAAATPPTEVITPPKESPDIATPEPDPPEAPSPA